MDQTRDRVDDHPHPPNPKSDLSETKDDQHESVYFGPHPGCQRHRRVVTELCARLDVKDPKEKVMKGGKIGIESCTFCLLLDETRQHDGIFVYVDLGLSHHEDKAHACKMLLKINFGLLAGAKGVMSYADRHRSINLSLQRACVLFVPLSARPAGFAAGACSPRCWNR